MSVREGMPIPNDWVEETDGYTLWMLCSPNSTQWRALVRGQIYELTRGRNWDINTGNIKDTQEIAWEVFNSMAQCDDLIKTQRMLIAHINGQPVDLDSALPTGVYDPAGRSFHDHLRGITPPNPTGDTIMESLQKLAESNGSITIADAIADLDSGGELGDIADLAEILNFLGVALPSFALTIPVGSLLSLFTEWRFKASVINLLEDMTLSQRIQATAQFGTSGHAVYDIFDDAAEKLLLPVGFAGAAVWLWNRVRPSQIGDWVQWVTDIGSLLLGNIRSAIYAVEDAIENKDLSVIGDFSGLASLSDIATALQNIDAEDIGPALATISQNIAALGTGELADIAANISTLNTDQLTAIAGNIADLELTCTCGANGSAGCGCGTIGEGTTPPSEEGEEGEIAPDGWEDPSDPQNPGGPPVTPGTQEYYDRKCLVANLQHDNIKQMTQKAIDLGIQDVLDGGIPLILMYGIVSTLLLSAVGELITPVPILDAFVFGIIGLMGTLLIALTSNNTNFSTMLTALDTYEEDLVCALFSATTPEEARIDYLGVLTGQAGLTVSETAWLSVILTADYLNTLFFDPITIENFAQQIANYNAAVDCGVCGPAWWDCSFGTLISYDAFTVELQAEVTGDGMYLAHIGVDSPLTLSASQVGWTPPTNAPDFATAYDTSQNRCGEGGGSPWTVKSSSFLPGPDLCYGRLYRSETQFTVTYTIN